MLEMLLSGRRREVKVEVVKSLLILLLIVFAVLTGVQFL